MTTRRISAPMLYGPHAPARWLRMLVAAIDHATTGLCSQQWQQGLARLQPVRIVSARAHRCVK